MLCSFSTSTKLIRYIRSVNWIPGMQTIDFTSQFNKFFVHSFHLHLSHSWTVTCTVSHQGAKLHWWKGYLPRKQKKKGGARVRVRLWQYNNPLPRPQTSCCSMHDRLTMWMDSVPIWKSEMSFGAGFETIMFKSYVPCARNETMMDQKTPIIMEQCVKLSRKMCFFVWTGAQKYFYCIMQRLKTANSKWSVPIK